MLSLFILL